MADPKALPLAQAGLRAQALRAEGKSIALCHGTFDLLHIGHVRHLQKAREFADALFVTITADRFVSKGPGRPVFNERLRSENLAALACVDWVSVVPEPTAIAAIEAIRPDVYVKGSDYQKPDEDITGNIARENRAVAEAGGRTVYTDEITFSSSKLLNEHFSVFSPEVKDYLRHFREAHTADEIIDAVKGLAGMKVCVIGDAIVDEYHYTDILGPTGKGNIFAVRHQHTERFAGGSLAVANHIAGFCGEVALMTGLGGRNSHEAFIREKLAANVTPAFFVRPEAPTLVKSRFVDMDAQKLFEVYYCDDSPPPESLAHGMLAWIEERAGEFDLVVAPDFGNGFITDAMARAISKHSRFLAVNTQRNSGNRGFHTVRRYPRADFVSLNEPELRLALHNRHDPVEQVAERVAAKVDADFIAVTQGTRGLLLRDMQARLTHQTPALSINVVDRVGAGDAFLSLASVCLAGGLGPELAAFVGAAAAAIDVQIVCNRESVTPVKLFKYITTLLK